MNAFFHWVKLNFERFLRAIEWPKWYFYGAVVLLFLLSIQVVDNWAAWAWIMIGFIGFSFNQLKD